MKDLEGYYDELQLQEMLINGEIKKIDYILHHDEDMTEDYRDFCKEKHLEYGSDASADVYFSYLTEQEEKEMKAGSSSFAEDDMNDNPDHVDSRDVPYCVKVYKEWNSDPELIEEMKNDMDAIYVTRWRLLNPMDNNMDDCMKKCDLDENVVNKWWDVINYIIGANGGYPVTPLNYSMNTIKRIINNAIPRK